MNAIGTCGALLGSVVAFAACGVSETNSRPTAAKADIEATVEGANAFAVDLYARLREEPGNLAFSPFSISTALAMTWAGARGETASQMEKTLHFALGRERLHPAMAGLAGDLNARGGGGSYELVVANRLWAQAGYAFLPEFLALNRTFYGAGLEQVDFAGAAERARRAINAWVEGETRGRIRDLVAPGVLDELTRLVLTNAIYFKGMWARRFEARATSDAPFHVAPGRSVTVPMMSQTAEFGYAETEALQVLEMPYVGGELSMAVLLPRALDGLGELEAALTAGNLRAWLARAGERKVAVFLPRFRVEAAFDLARTLGSMGMPDAFGEKADFSGMDGTRLLCISAVLHKAFVDVNEEGTEAAAATAVAMKLRAVAQHPVFRADHPFIFLIRDRKTGVLLFVGRVANPAGSTAAGRAGRT